MRRGGFSLVELLVAIAIIGVLVAVGFANYQGLRKKAKGEEAKSHGGAVAQVVASYLSVNLEKTARDFMALPAVQSLPSPDLAKAPAAVRREAQDGDKDCSASANLGSPTYAWPEAPRGVGCLLGVRQVGGFERVRVYTWVVGSEDYYVDGQSP